MDADPPQSPPTATARADSILSALSMRSPPLTWRVFLRGAARGVRMPFRWLACAFAWLGGLHLHWSDDGN